MNFQFRLLPVVCALTLTANVSAQEASFPLEAVNVQGTAAVKSAVIGITGFRIGTPVNKAAIENGCQKLQESGLFATVAFSYAPGPKRGYVVTLNIEDHAKLMDAAIDLPGIDEKEAWQWLGQSYPAFNHKVPELDPAQQFLARQIEQHLGDKLNGQHLATPLETDLATGRNIVSFQPEHLPKIEALQFRGQKEISEQDLRTILAKVTDSFGYTDRRFRGLAESNLRRAYEDRGMYRAKFSGFVMEKSSPGGVGVTTTIDEGPKFKLGQVTLTGDSLPEKAMRAAAKFKTGEVANWTLIQQGIWEAEKPLKRTGYLAASTHAQRTIHDDTQVLDLNLVYAKGPLFHFGQLHINGLAPDLEAKVRKSWHMESGDPFDYMYASELMREFSKTNDLRQVNKYSENTEKGPGDNVMDIWLLFGMK